MNTELRWTWFAGVALLSWPPMIASALWATSAEAVLFLNVSAMLGAAAATWLHARWRNEPLRSSQWRWGQPRHYLSALFFCVGLWWLPAGIDVVTGQRRIVTDHLFLTILVSAVYLLLIPLAGFCEELAWRGYLLPKLLPRGSRTAMVGVGVVWGLWHGPLIVLDVVRHGTHGTLSAWLSGLGLLCLTTALTIPLSAIFAFAWRRSNSLFLVAFLHGEYDGLRDLAGWFLAGKPGQAACSRSSWLPFWGYGS